MADNQVAIVTPEAAKARALKVLEANKECVSFVRPEDLDTAALFVPVVSVVKPVPGDFYDPIPGIGIMAKPPLVNLLAEKSGVSILRTETSKRGEWVWHAHAYGEKRMPDGTMRQDDAGYEFDAEKRAELDAINQPAKYGTEIAKRKHLLETAKFGEQRAVTGAQFALIHKLGKISRSFRTPDELMRGMIVLRIDRNVDGLLKDPEMRGAAIQMALGARAEVFGPTNGGGKARDVTPAPLAITEAPAEDPEPDFGDAPAEPVVEEETPTERARDQLAEWLEHDAVKAHKPKDPKKQTAAEAIRSLLARKDATLDELTEMIGRCVALAKRTPGGAT